MALVPAPDRVLGSIPQVPGAGVRMEKVWGEVSRRGPGRALVNLGQQCHVCPSAEATAVGTSSGKSRKPSTALE